MTSSQPNYFLKAPPHWGFGLQHMTLRRGVGGTLTFISEQEGYMNISFIAYSKINHTYTMAVCISKLFKNIHGNNNQSSR